MTRKIILASNNKGKLEEITEKLAPLGIKVISIEEANIKIKVDETGTTYRENAELKADEVYRKSKTPVIADDSGFEVDYLDGKPRNLFFKIFWRKLV